MSCDAPPLPVGRVAINRAIYARIVTRLSYKYKNILGVNDIALQAAVQLATFAY